MAGLGNPGERYAGTRHDVGFMVVSRLAAETAETAGTAMTWRRVGGCEVAGEGAPRGIVGRWLARLRGASPSGAPMLLARPMLFMNRSGPPLAALLESVGLGPERLLVVTDDVNLPLGRLRLRASGSSGGHNGLASIIEEIGDGFPRLRLGVGGAPRGTELADWVLSHFREDEREEVTDLVRRASETVLDVVENGVDAAMPRVAVRPGGSGS